MGCGPDWEHVVLGREATPEAWGPWGTSWRRRCEHGLARPWPALRPAPSPIKRRLETWHNYPEPFLDVTLLQTQYFDSFCIR